MKITNLLFTLLFSGIIAWTSNSKACSPWSALTLTNYEIIGDFLYLDITSNTGWQCCYTAQVELACASGSFTGSWNHVSQQICKGSGSGSFSSWSTPEPFPTLAIDISQYCPGTELMFRLRENGPDGFGPISPTFNIVVPGTSGVFEASVVANPTVVCLGDCSDLIGSADNNCDVISYLWSTGETTPSINVCPSETTTYTFTATDAGGICGPIEVTEQITIVVDNTLEAGEISVTPLEVCTGDEVELVIENHIGQVQWQSSSNPTGPWVDIPGATTSQYNFGPLTGDTYFQATVSNCVGEEVTNNVLVTVYDYPNADFSSTGVCLGGTTDFTDLSTVANGTIDTWDWDFGGGNTSNDQNPSHNFTNAGDNSVSLTVWNNGLCPTTIDLDVTVFPIPEVFFNFTTVCANETTQLIDSSMVALPSSIVSWEWDILDDGNVNYTTQNATHVFSEGGTYAVSLTVVSDAGCENSTTVQVVVNPVPDASLIASPISGQVPLVVEFTNNSTGGTGHSWDFGNGNIAFSSTADNQTEVFTDPGQYVITLVVDNGLCSDEATVVINALNLPLTFNPPNIFTPNGDGQNDVLHFRLENAASAYVEIRNRWGNLVGIIDSVDDQLGWDGTDYKSGKLVSDGVYFYTYEFENLDGEFVTGHGFVHVKQ